MAASHRQFFEDYAKTYDAFDIKRMITYAHCPMITVQQGEPKVHATPEEVEGFFSQLLVWFRGIEHEHASISHLDVQPLGEKSAFAKVVWRSHRKGGKPDLEWPTAYHLVNPGSGWKILAIILRYEPAQEVRDFTDL